LFRVLFREKCLPDDYPDRRASTDYEMSTYVLMRLLESSPRRYELGMRLLTLGRLDEAYDRLALHIESGQQVLDIGCGTGALTLRAARRGAQVKGIDTHAQMLEMAEEQVKREGYCDSVELVEMGVAELDAEAAQAYDVVTAGLCLSELSDDEVRYTLKHTARILRPGGLLLIVDELEPHGIGKRLAHFLLRVPLVALTYLLTQQTTHPAANLPEKLKSAGFDLESIRLSSLGSFGELVARKPTEPV
jgi:demethylmenaquinone methyltransferase/2-methoxy-6-polyprenyl-1,4-benzoquinol methylase